MEWDHVKVFSATKSRDRERLGEVVTDWIREHGPDIKEHIVRQSSDAEFHCISITLFYKNTPKRKRKEGKK